MTLGTPGRNFGPVIFSLEALQAEQGDCFLIHFGDTGAPQVMLVDGGPGRDVYDARLKARLNALRSHFGALELSLVVCSHIDDDHIGGVLALVQDVELGALDIKINCLWHNRPLDLVGEADDQRLAAILREDEHAERYATAWTKQFVDENWEVDPNFAYVVASVQEGDELYADAKEASIPINCGFDGGLVMARTPEEGYAHITIDDLDLLVIGPDAAQIEALRKKWQKETKGQSVDELCDNSAKIAALVAANDDASVTNLSSIVFLAEFGGRSILMTGDARGDYVIDGLTRAGRLGAGSAHVDVLKLQHHGSARNNDEHFFATVTADEYVISANGLYGNPDPATFDALVTARGQNGYRIWLTNGAPGTPIASTVAAIKGKYPSMTLNVRPSQADGFRVDLGDPVGY